MAETVGGIERRIRDLAALQDGGSLLQALGAHFEGIAARAAAQHRLRPDHVAADAILGQHPGAPLGIGHRPENDQTSCHI